jgi:hypothetical protein
MEEKMGKLKRVLVASAPLKWREALETIVRKSLKFFEYHLTQCLWALAVIFQVANVKVQRIKNAH